MGNTESAQFPYKIGDEIIAPLSGGGGGGGGYGGGGDQPLWKHYQGTKTSTGELVSIFTFDRSRSAGDQALALNHLKHLKTLRHPCMLKYVDSVELPQHIHVVTEPVTPLLKDELAADGVTADATAAAASVVLGLYQLVQAVAWLNNDAKMVHSLLCPSSVYVTRAGDWRLSGLELCHKANEPLPDFVAQHRTTRMPAAYKPPELISGGGGGGRSGGDNAWSVDAWSLGCFIYAAFHGLQKYTSATQLSAPSRVPAALLPDYKRLLTQSVATRLNPQKLVGDGDAASSSFFHSHALVSCMRFLDALALRTAEEKEKFFARLADQVLPHVPPRCAKFKILPLLTSALDMMSVPPASPAGGAGGAAAAAAATAMPPQVFAPLFGAVLRIGNTQLMQDEFTLLVVPTLTKLYASQERFVRVHLLRHLDDYAPCLAPELVNDTLFAQMVTGLTDAAPLLRELTVKAMAPLILMKKGGSGGGGLAPQHVETVLRVLTTKTDPEPAIRLHTVVVLGKIAPHLTPAQRDKQLAPALAKAVRDPFPPARMAAVAAWVAALDLLAPLSNTPATPAAIQITWAQRVLPVLAPLLADDVKEVRATAFKAVHTVLGKIQTWSDQNGDIVAAAAPAGSPGAGAGVGASGGGGGAGGVPLDPAQSKDAGTYLQAGVSNLASGIGSWAMNSFKNKLLGGEEDSKNASGSMPMPAAQRAAAAAAAASTARTTSAPAAAAASKPVVTTTAAATVAPAAAKKAATTTNSSSMDDDFFDDFNDDDDDPPAPVLSLSTKDTKKPAAAAVTKPATTTATTTTAVAASSTGVKKSILSAATVAPTLSAAKGFDSDDWAFDMDKPASSSSFSSSAPAAAAAAAAKPAAAAAAVIKKPTPTASSSTKPSILAAASSSATAATASSSSSSSAWGWDDDFGGSSSSSSSSSKPAAVAAAPTKAAPAATAAASDWDDWGDSFSAAPAPAAAAPTKSSSSLSLSSSKPATSTTPTSAFSLSKAAPAATVTTMEADLFSSLSTSKPASSSSSSTIKSSSSLPSLSKPPPAALSSPLSLSSASAAANKKPAGLVAAAAAPPAAAAAAKKKSADIDDWNSFLND